MAQTPPSTSGSSLSHQASTAAGGAASPGALLLLGLLSALIAVGSLAANGLFGLQGASAWVAHERSRAAAMEQNRLASTRQAPPNRPYALTPEQVDAVVKAAQQRAGSPVQIESLRKVLSSPTQRMVAPCTSPAEAAAQLRSVQTVPSGAIVVLMSNNGGSISANGTPMGGLADYVKPDANSASDSQDERISTASMVVLDAGVSVLLALLLLLAGIAAIAGSAHAPGLHRVYALLKILTAAGAGMLWVRGGFTPITTNGVGGAWLASWIVYIAILLAAGCIYPLAILMVFGVFSRKSAKAGASAAA